MIHKETRYDLIRNGQIVDTHYSFRSAVERAKQFCELAVWFPFPEKRTYLIVHKNIVMRMVRYA